MAVLECNVATCVYNESDKCCRSNINVDGKEALKSASTYCDSFNKRGCGCTNSNHIPENKVNIECSATKCVYNDSYICKATVVGVVGRTAGDKDQTECATFKCR